MRLIIDVTELAGWRGKLTGVPRVMNELTTRFVRDYDQAEVLLVAWDATRLGYTQVAEPLFDADEEVQPQVRKHGRVYRVTVRIVRKIGLIGLAKRILGAAKSSGSPSSGAGILDVKKDDVVFVLADWHGADYNFIKYITNLKKTGCRLVQISYDLLPVVTPQYSGHSTNTFRQYLEEVYPVADLVIAISENTKNDAEDWLHQKGLNVPVFKVMRLGDDFELSKPKLPMQYTEFFKDDKKRFMLTVGTIEARKNHALLYYVYKLARTKNVKLPKIVVVGRRGWKTDDIYELIATDPDTKDMFLFMHHVNDEELAWLYKNCLFSVYPSFYEGWGLPIAESIANGVPCICSNTSSMPEVAGDFAIYFNPNSADECLTAMTHLLKGNNLKEQRKKISDYRTISWEETYNKVSSYISGVK